MDTKLKSYSFRLFSPQGIIYMISWLLCITCASCMLVFASMALALNKILEIERFPDAYAYVDESGETISVLGPQWECEVTDRALLNEQISGYGSAAMWVAVIAVVFLVVLIALTGGYKRAADGTIHLNWFDRIWSEVQLIAGIGTACFAGVITFEGLLNLWPCVGGIGAFKLAESGYSPSGLPNTLTIEGTVMLITGSVAMTVICLISVIKKLKAHQFWERSLLGGIWLALYRSFRGSDQTMGKVMGVLLIGSLLCATWICVPVVIILILFFVPKQVKKFKGICDGVEEIRSGNLNYEIPVEEDYKGKQGEFDRLAASINKISEAQKHALEEEMKSQRMKTDLISNVSHDLKTPLTSMVTYVDLLKTEGLDSPDAPEYLDIIDQKTRRLQVLTENLFDAAKASSGAIPVHMEAIDLSALVSQSLAEMEEKLNARQLQVVVKNLCENNCHVMADGQLLWRVIENLLSNVSKYALTGSRVYLNISRVPSGSDIEVGGAGNDRILFEVKNISAEQLNISADELMERFKRGDESRNTEGSGLGLAIAKDLVTLMHGSFVLTVDGDLFKASVLLREAAVQKSSEQMSV